MDGLSGKNGDFKDSCCCVPNKIICQVPSEESNACTAKQFCSKLVTDGLSHALNEFLCTTNLSFTLSLSSFGGKVSGSADGSEFNLVSQRSAIADV